MPYIHITDVMECIDDVNSNYYNQIVSRSVAEEGNTLDWQSSEKMRNAGIYYELGVVVDHNSNDIVNGAGSCIFLHNWKTPDETMEGCTGMSPETMKQIVYWLDDAKSPLLVQLTKQLYDELREDWYLPVLKDFVKN
jgi:L,D-peptidoglycan transpeptidase YkuD (ErfK/YbiS/YcfS/YnhG family)